ncbi:MAG: protein-L-isoaspartate(D-aspartate) O-methyltransferase [Pseudomonadota bacterium]
MGTALGMATALSRADHEGFAAFLLRIRAAGISNHPLETAIESVTRRVFVDPAYHGAVWGSRGIPIDCGEVLEGLDQQAMMIDRLELSNDHRVLEIGTGSGYSAAIMAKLAKRVFTIERFKRLHASASETLRQLEIENVVCSHASAETDLPALEGPFDRIICWAAYDELPRAFSEQLTSGGKIICAVGEADKPQILLRLTKVGSRFEREDIGVVRMQMIKSGLPETL